MKIARYILRICLEIFPSPRSKFRKNPSKASSVTQSPENHGSTVNERSFLDQDSAHQALSSVTQSIKPTLIIFRLDISYKSPGLARGTSLIDQKFEKQYRINELTNWFLSNLSNLDRAVGCRQYPSSFFDQFRNSGGQAGAKFLLFGRGVVYRQYVRFGCVKTGVDSRRPDQKAERLLAMFSEATMLIR